MPQYEATETIGGRGGNVKRSPSSHLRPEDAFHAHSPPRGLQHHASPLGPDAIDNAAAVASDVGVAPGMEASAGRRKKEKRRGRSVNGKGKGAWKKLLWVKQPCMCSPRFIISYREQKIYKYD